MRLLVRELSEKAGGEIDSYAAIRLNERGV
jgi:hypothetical protein